jgi:hypothetical protein
MGWNYSTGSNTITTGSINIRSAQQADLPADDTTTSNNNPWLEFSQTIKFQNEWAGFF